MNKYQSLYESKARAVDADSLVADMDNVTHWEDGYWLAKVLMANDYGVSDQRIMELLEDCFFMGLSVTNKAVFFDANECLAKLYIRYGMYDEAASKLIMLASNYDCPDWVHLYLAMSQLHTSTFDRVVEEPKFFFERLLKADSNDITSRKEVKNIFGNYLCMIVEKTKEGSCSVASPEIIHFAEKIKMTSSEEFKLFHKAVCPTLDYEVISDESDEIILLRTAETQAKQKASILEAELTKIQNEHKATKDQLTQSRSENKATKEELTKSRSEQKAIREQLERTQKEKNADKAIFEQKLQKSEDAYKELETKNTSLEQEKTDLQKRVQELEKAKQTQMEPQNIDDVFLTLNSWLNVTLRRYLAQWLTERLIKSCRDNYWNKKVKPALRPKEVEKFDSYKELTDFAIDALLNIYFYNLDDFYSFNCMAKTNDKDRIKEMQQIRNRWVGHFEENSWTKEKILFDIDTILEFIEQIEMPRSRQKEYRDFRSLVQKMN